VMPMGMEMAVPFDMGDLPLPTRQRLERVEARAAHSQQCFDPNQGNRRTAACIGVVDDETEGQGNGEPDFEVWFRREYPKVLGSLVLALGNREVAEEATAEAFARAYERWSRVRLLVRPGGWVYMVAINEAKRKLRRRTMERSLLLKFHVEPEAPPETGFELWDLVRTLPPRERTAIVLRYVGDLPEAEVARAMGITAGGVAKMLNVARSRIGSTLDSSPDIR
jgi:RNA polymerase sigma factor (sigma-70 family)